MLEMKLQSIEKPTETSDDNVMSEVSDDGPTVEWNPVPEMKRDVIPTPENFMAMNARVQNLRTVSTGDNNNNNNNNKRDAIQRPELRSTRIIPGMNLPDSNVVKAQSKRNSVDLDASMLEGMNLGALDLNPMLDVKRDVIDMNPMTAFLPDSMPIRLRKYSEMSKRGTPVYSEPQYGMYCTMYCNRMNGMTTA